jgi:WD40 repeat protein
MSKSPRTGVESASQDVCPQGTPSRAHPCIGLNLVGRIQRHSGWVYSVAISPDASRIASCSNDRTVRIIQASHVASDSDSSGGIVLNGHSHAVRCCAFNSSGSLLATASWDGDVRVWDVVSGACQRVISPAASGNRVYACAWAVSGTDASEVLATAGGGGGTCPVDFALRIWKLVGDEEASCRVLGGHTKAVTCLAFAADGISLASSSDDHTVCSTALVLFNVLPCHLYAKLTRPQLRVWDVASGSCSLVMSHENAVCCCCWGPGVPSSSSSNDSCYRTIASGDQDSFVIVWNADTGILIVCRVFLCNHV